MAASQGLPVWQCAAVCCIAYCPPNPALVTLHGEPYSSGVHAIIPRVTPTLRPSRKLCIHTNMALVLCISFLQNLCIKMLFVHMEKKTGAALCVPVRHKGACLRKTWFVVTELVYHPYVLEYSRSLWSLRCSTGLLFLLLCVCQTA